MRADIHQKMDFPAEATSRGIPTVTTASKHQRKRIALAVRSTRIGYRRWISQNKTKVKNKERYGDRMSNGQVTMAAD